MSIDITEHQRLVKKATQARADRDKAVGGLEATMATLQKDYDVETIEAGQELLEEMELTATKAEAEYDEAVENFEESWSEHVEND